MNTSTVSLAGRIVFALAITAFGTLCVAYGDFLSALQPVPASIPAQRLLAIATGVLLLGAGLAILVDRGTGRAARLLIVLFLSWILLLHIPSAFLEPRLLRSPWWIRTFETVALTGAAVILAAGARPPVPASWLRAGRIAYGAALPVFGTLHLIYPESVAALIPPWYPLPMFWAYFTGVAQIAGGIAIAANVLPRLAPALAGVMYGSWALTLHVPRIWCQAFGPCQLMPEVAGLESLRPGLTSLFVAVGMCGAAWIVAGRTASGAVEHRDDPIVEGSYVRT